MAAGQGWGHPNPLDPPTESREREIPRGIFYIDEQPLSRECISRQLAAHLPQMEVVPRRAVEDISNSSVEADRFALAVLNTHAGRVGEQRACRVCDKSVAAELSMLKEILPAMPVVVVSEIEDVQNIIDAFQRGVRGYVPTTMTIEDVVEAIRFVWVGGTFVPTSVLALPSRLLPVEHRPPQGIPLSSFTRRQQEVLHLLWKGKQNKAIAFELRMCESTVKVHVRQIMKRLHASNRTQVVVLTRPPSLDNRAILGDRTAPPAADRVASAKPSRFNLAIQHFDGGGDPLTRKNGQQLPDWSEKLR
jgi:DNA-binding NarL/FixJ family response regulator